MWYTVKYCRGDIDKYRRTHSQFEKKAGFTKKQLPKKTEYMRLLSKTMKQKI